VATGSRLTEPWVAVDPADPLHAVLVGQGKRMGGVEDNWIAGAVTFDGGRTWNETTPTTDVPGSTVPAGAPIAAVDAMVAFGHDGKVLLAALAGGHARDPAAGAGGAFWLDLVTWTSTDGGRTFPRAVVAVPGPAPMLATPAGLVTPGSLDKDLLFTDASTRDAHLVYTALTPVGAAGHDTLYHIASGDDGLTWSQPQAIDEGGYGAAGAAVDGHLLLLEQDPDIVALTSADGGATWTKASTLAHRSRPWHSLGAAWWRDGGNLTALAAYQEGGRGERVVLRVSQDGGTTWSEAADALPPAPTAARNVNLAVDPATGNGLLAAYAANGTGSLADLRIAPLLHGQLRPSFVASAAPEDQQREYPYEYLGVAAFGAGAYAVWQGPGSELHAARVAFGPPGG
jgi:hypothetical protein